MELRIGGSVSNFDYDPLSVSAFNFITNAGGPHEQTLTTSWGFRDQRNGKLVLKTNGREPSYQPISISNMTLESLPGNIQVDKVRSANTKTRENTN